MKKYAILLCLLLVAGNAFASIAVRTDGGTALVDLDGGEIVPFGIYDDIVPLGNDLFAAALQGKSALMNAEGALLTDHAYDHILHRDGLLMAGTDGKWRLLAENGRAKTGLDYGLIIPNGFGGAWAMHGTNDVFSADELFLLDEEGREEDAGMMVRRMGEQSGNGLLAVMQMDADTFVYVNTDGEIAFDADYETAGSFVNGAAIVSDGGYFGAINTEGEWILPPEYTFADVHEDGMVLAVNADGAILCGIDGNIRWRISGENLSAAFAGENVLVYNGEDLFVYTLDGVIRNELPSDAAVYAGLEGRLIISEGAWGEHCVYLDGTPDKYQNIYPLGRAKGEAVYAFMEVRAVRYMNNLLGEAQLSADMNTARYGIMDQNGEILLPARYLQLEYLCDNRFLVRTENQWRMIDINGSVYWRRRAEVS